MTVKLCAIPINPKNGKDGKGAGKEVASAVKSADCSPRGPGGQSQNLHGGLQPPWISSFRESKACLWPSQALGTQIN